MALVLGYSAYFHDSSACIIRDGALVAAAAEERFSRKKHDASFPEQAIRFCLEEAGVSAEELDAVVFYEKPFTKLDRILETYLQVSPAGFGSFRRFARSWLSEKFWVEDRFRKCFRTKASFSFYKHHLSHIAATALTVPLEKTAFLVIDGVGERACTSFGIVENGHIQVMGEQHFPHSIGLLYSAFTQYCGFKVNSGEYKLMGLAPYGKPVYRDLIFGEFVRIDEQGVVQLQLDKFGFREGLHMINRKFEWIFKKKARKPSEPMTDFFKDVAASIQQVTEELVLTVMRYVHQQTQCDQLVYAGGVALNCVINARVLEATPFKEVHIPSAAGDSGCALGAAAWKAHSMGDQLKWHTMDYTGPAYSDADIRAFLQEGGIQATFPGEGLFGETAAYLAESKVVGWFQGRMELGPRALGNRSILANPGHPEMQQLLNQKIKKREAFRPFAPVVLDRSFDRYFIDKGGDYSRMLLTAATTPKAVEIPSCVHVDGSARVQRLEVQTNPSLYALLEAFEKRTGCPVLINTSFNERGEPMVCSPQDALDCFFNTDMDVLVMGGALVRKEDNQQYVKTHKVRHYAAD